MDWFVRAVVALGLTTLPPATIGLENFSKFEIFFLSPRIIYYMGPVSERQFAVGSDFRAVFSTRSFRGLLKVGVGLIHISKRSIYFSAHWSDQTQTPAVFATKKKHS